MSDAGDDGAIPRPRQTHGLFGHAAAERELLDAYRSGRIPHAWLIGGPPGIGKATLAYRMARFVLAHPDPGAPAVRNAASLAVPPEHPAARRVAAQGHGNLLVLERGLNDKGKLRQDIAVDDVRAALPFFGSTAAEQGWRAVIVDAVEELNRSGANALLKILEEPPPRALLLLVTHAPGRVMPTIRSRCRLLTVQSLSEDEVAGAVTAALGEASPTAEIRAAAAAADGSVGRALMYLEGDALELRRQVVALLERLPQYDPRALHALADELAGTEAETLAAFMDAVNGWLSSRLRAGSQQGRSLARVGEVWERVNLAARETEVYNLDRKPFVFAVFGHLAEAARA